MCCDATPTAEGRKNATLYLKVRMDKRTINYRSKRNSFGARDAMIRQFILQNLHIEQLSQRALPEPSKQGRANLFRASASLSDRPGPKALRLIRLHSEQQLEAVHGNRKSTYKCLRPHSFGFGIKSDRSSITSTNQPTWQRC
uniref:Uncharacterized protein n=1 Tax=Globodera rostochiensis TaxID=31243 RepID=A0A914HI25_GLORO